MRSHQCNLAQVSSCDASHGTCTTKDPSSVLTRCAQVQASAWSRWRFGDKQAKTAEVQSTGAEIFIMLPLGIIAVGELSEGEEVSFIHQCVADGQCHTSTIRSVHHHIAFNVIMRARSQTCLAMLTWRGLIHFNSFSWHPTKEATSHTSMSPIPLAGDEKFIISIGLAAPCACIRAVPATVRVTWTSSSRPLRRPALTALCWTSGGASASARCACRGSALLLAVPKTQAPLLARAL